MLRSRTESLVSMKRFKSSYGRLKPEVVIFYPIAEYGELIPDYDRGSINHVKIKGYELTPYYHKSKLVYLQASKITKDGYPRIDWIILPYAFDAFLKAEQSDGFGRDTYSEKADDRYHLLNAYPEDTGWREEVLKGWLSGNVNLAKLSWINSTEQLKDPAVWILSASGWVAAEGSALAKMRSTTKTGEEVIILSGKTNSTIKSIHEGKIPGGFELVKKSDRYITLRVKSLAAKEVTAPKGWITTTSKKGGGTVFKDPNNPHNIIRQMPGNPTSPNLAQRSPYVKFMKDGKFYDAKGNPLTSGDLPDAHIPLNQFDINKMPKF